MQESSDIKCGALIAAWLVNAEQFTKHKIDFLELVEATLNTGLKIEVIDTSGSLHPKERFLNRHANLMQPNSYLELRGLQLALNIARQAVNVDEPIKIKGSYAGTTIASSDARRGIEKLLLTKEFAAQFHSFVQGYIFDPLSFGTLTVETSAKVSKSGLKRAIRILGKERGAWDSLAVLKVG